MTRNIPIFPTPGVKTPGQLGPTNLVFDPFISLLTLCISLVGIPSVMHTTNQVLLQLILKLHLQQMVVVQKPHLHYNVDFFASTVLKTGTFKCFDPPFSGVTPPYYICVVCYSALRVEGALSSSKSLTNNFFDSFVSNTANYFFPLP